MDAISLSIQDQPFNRESFDATEADEKRLQELKDLSERQAGWTMAGCRDTIDSILFKCGEIRSEVDQNPRIGLVLSAESDTTPIQQPSPAFISSVIDTPFAQGPDNLSKDGDVSPSDTRLQSETSSTRDLMFEYAEHLQQVTVVASGAGGGLIDDTPMFSSDDSDKHDTDASWDGQDDIVLSIYAELDDDIFQSKAETEPIYYAEQGANADAGIALVHEIDPCALMNASSLAMSPVVHMATVDPHVATSEVQDIKSTWKTVSSSGYDKHHALAIAPGAVRASSAPSPTTTEHDGLASPIEGSPGFSTATMLGILQESQLRTGSLVPEDSVSNYAILAVDLNAYRQNHHRVIWQPVLGYNVADLLDGIPEHLNGDVVHWLDRVEAREEATAADQERNEKAAPSFLAWLENDNFVEHMLNAGMAVALSVVALAGHVLW